MKLRFRTSQAILLLLLTATQVLRAQTGSGVTFLRMETDARSAGMAGAGALLPERTDAIHGNAAGVLFGTSRGGAEVSVGPLGGSASDRLWSGAGFWSADGRNALLSGVRRLAGVEIPMTDDKGFPAGTARPWDLSAEAGYARRFGSRVAVALTARYIRSDFDLGDSPIQGVSFDLAAALRGKFAGSDKIGWVAGIRVADLGPDLRTSDGQRLSLPTRGSVEGLFTWNPHRNHAVHLCADLGYRWADTLFDAAFGVEYRFLQHGVLRAGYCTQTPCGTDGHAAVGCGFIIGPIRGDVAYRFGGAENDPSDQSFLLTFGFRL